VVDGFHRSGQEHESRTRHEFEKMSVLNAGRLVTQDELLDARWPLCANVEFLTKPFRDQDLLDAIQQALQLDRAARERQDEVHTLQGRYLALTTREREVMRLVVTGKLNKQIASEIGASEATVKIHRSNVMQKMQAQSLIELVRMADKLKPVLPE
jgi:DNA-binding CsgD family transcriptional regulator